MQSKHKKNMHFDIIDMYTGKQNKTVVKETYFSSCILILFPLFYSHHHNNNNKKSMYMTKDISFPLNFPTRKGNFKSW